MKRQPSEYYGFVYRITASDSEELPKEIRGKIYIGKKQFRYRKKRALSKKKKKLTGKRVEVTMVDSNWIDYYGSNKQLQEDVKQFGKKYFKREVLHLCFTKSQLSYYEVAEQIAHNVLSINSYNGWISCKIFKSRFTTKEALESKD